jgi:hypothetical protein
MMVRGSMNMADNERTLLAGGEERAPPASQRRDTTLRASIGITG